MAVVSQPGTVHNLGQNGFASAQLIQNIRVGLFECGWFDEGKLIIFRHGIAS